MAFETPIMARHKPPRGAVLNAGHPLARNMVLCFIANENAGTILKDYSGNDNFGQLFNVDDTNWRNGAIYFNGSDEYGAVGASPTLAQLGDGAFSAAFYSMRPSTAASTATPIWLAGITTFTHMAITYDDYDRIALDVYMSGTNYRVYSAFVVSEDEWHNLVITKPATYTASDARVYMDGMNIGTSYTQDGTGSSVDDSLSQKRFMRNNYGGYNSGPWACLMLWNRELSAAEARMLNQDIFCMFRQVTPAAVFYVAGGTVHQGEAIISETTSVTSAVIASLSGVASLTETTSVVSSAVADYNVIASLSETTNVTSSVGHTMSVTASISETTSVTSSADVAILIEAIISETTSVTSSAVASLSAVASISETTSVAAVVNAVYSALAVISETTSVVSTADLAGDLYGEAIINMTTSVASSATASYSAQSVISETTAVVAAVNAVLGAVAEISATTSVTGACTLTLDAVAAINETTDVTAIVNALYNAVASMSMTTNVVAYYDPGYKRLFVAFEIAQPGISFSTAKPSISFSTKSADTSFELIEPD